MKTASVQVAGAELAATFRRVAGDPLTLSLPIADDCLLAPSTLHRFYSLIN
jgi:hypothetical protein